MRVTNGIPLGCSLRLPIDAANCVQILKVLSDKLGISQLGKVSVVGGILSHAFTVSTIASGAREWVEYNYFFEPTSPDHTLRFEGHDVYPGGAVVLISTVEISPCGTSAASKFDAVAEGVDAGSAIAVTVTPEGIRAEWHPHDSESGIAQIQWAAGTMAHGDQLALFTGVGAAATHGQAWVAAGIPHGTQVHVTVAVTNRAGTTAIFNAPAVTADHTPPIGSITLPRGFGTGVIIADLSGVVDPETDVVSCSWAVGTQPGLSDLFAWAVADLTSAAAVTTGTAMSGAMHGSLVYAAARCENAAGLGSFFVSNSAYLILDEIVVGGAATVEIVAPPTHTSVQVQAAYVGVTL
jgi:hypothetical protein